jgi:transcriptional regulator with XRE-family HTH domain
MAAVKHSPAQVALGRAVRWNRARRGWSRNKLGQIAGVHYNHIGQIERGEVSPTFSMLRRLTGALQIPLWRLIAEGEKIERELVALPQRRG